jgi:hypothetical protein
MDGGSGLNLMFLDTFEGLGLTWDHLQSGPHPSFGVLTGKQYVPPRRVTLLVTFRGMRHYHTEMPTFELVNFFGPCHLILGCPCYHQVHGYPQLHLPHAQDTQTPQGYHFGSQNAAGTGL